MSVFSTNGRLMLLELCVYAVVTAWALKSDGIRSRLLGTLSRGYRRLATGRTASVFAVIAVVLFVRGALLPLLPPPVPGVHDEFSYLLAADTFTSGRLTNSPHPLWEAFETFYVIQQPTYASMYPPAQGIVLAFGKVLGGHPWIGVYLSSAVMCGAICWMLQGWVPLSWALTGGLLAAVRWGIFSYWTESYWGGTVAAIGGALIAGALPRIFRSRSVWPPVVFVAGMLVLANSRPFEGLIYGLPFCAVLLYRMSARRESSWRLHAKRILLPAVAVGLVGGCAMGYYFWRITGSPIRMPYQINEAAYQLTGPFFWQPLRKPPVYRHAVMEQYFVPRETAAYARAHSMRGLATEALSKFTSIAMFFFWPAILPTIAAMPWLWKNRQARFALIIGALMLFGLNLEMWPMALHYPAPMTAMMVLLLVQVMRFWRVVRWRGRPVGAAISTAIPLFCVSILAVRLGAAIVHAPVPQYGLVPWFTVAPGNVDRANMQQFLENQNGQQLVLVRYAKGHNLFNEWVHNDADIDGSKVVWARDDNPGRTIQLREYFHDRRIWTLEADEQPPRLTDSKSAPFVTTDFTH